TVDPALHGEGGRYLGGAEPVDHQEGVLAVFFTDIEGGAMDVLAGDRQARQLGQQMTAYFGQVVRVVAADVEHRAGFLGEGVQTYGEQAQLAGRTGGFEQARRVGVEASRSVGV